VAGSACHQRPQLRGHTRARRDYNLHRTSARLTDTRLVCLDRSPLARHPRGGPRSRTHSHTVSRQSPSASQVHYMYTVYSQSMRSHSQKFADETLCYIPYFLAPVRARAPTGDCLARAPAERPPSELSLPFPCNGDRCVLRRTPPVLDLLCPTSLPCENRTHEETRIGIALLI
jgi:hypothetical protein